MFTAKIVSLLRIILLVTCSSQHCLVKSVVSGHPGAIDTDIVFMVDFSRINQSDVDSIGKLSDNLFRGFTAKGAKLRIAALAMSTSTVYDYMAAKYLANVPDFLNIQFKRDFNFEWRTELDRNNVYGTALAYSETIFKKEQRPGVGRAVMMVAHMHDICGPGGCFDTNIEPCARKSSRPSIGSADHLKKQLGVTVITVGVGYEVNTSNLRCFASEPQMFIHYNDYMKLRQKGAAKRILDLLFQIRPYTGTPAVRSSIITTLPTTMFSNKRTNAPASLTVTGIHLTGQGARNESFLVATKSTSAIFSYNWWILLVIAIIVVALLLSAALLGTVMWRRKRKKGSWVPTVPAGNAGGFTRHQQPYPSSNWYNSTSSFVQNQSSHLLKKPYLEPDLYTATRVEKSKPPDYGVMIGKQASLARPTNTAFKVYPKPPGTAHCKGAVRDIEQKGKVKSSPGNFKQPTTFGSNTGGRTTQKVKGVGFVGIPEQKRPWHKGNMIDDRQGRVKHMAR